MHYEETRVCPECGETAVCRLYDIGWRCDGCLRKTRGPDEGFFPRPECGEGDGDLQQGR